MAGIKIDPEMLDIYMESLNKLMAGSETDGGNARLEVSGAGKTEDGLVQYNEEVNKLGDDLRELYETIRVNVDEEEQWKVFDFVEDFFMEELEIGDYINDINSYHLHMFDKHDVTTKKFDAIVEKAGKVDANYAAQIEGYCSLLGEYGKKFEAVCAMLQPEKLRLSPDKYREKLEGINTGYQNAKDTHEQEQSAYEAELYEIETVWYKKMLDKAEDYLIRSAECVVLGNFTDEVTVLGVGVQIVLGIFDLDLPCDIRDIIADIKNLAETDRVRWDLIGMLALDLIGLIPVIGALKYSDEVGTLFKNAGKVSVVAEGADGVGAVARHADEAGAWLQGVKVFRYSDETAEAVASGEKLLKESGTIYESFADMMSPEDAKRYLDFLENGSREGLTSAELADALLVSQKVGYEDVWDLRNAGDLMKKETLEKLKEFNISDCQECLLGEKYVNFEEYLNHTVCGEGMVGENNYLLLWEKNEIEELNDDYETQAFLNNIILIGSDGGDMAYGIDISGKYIEVPFIGMDDEEVKVIAEDFDGFIDYVWNRK